MNKFDKLKAISNNAAKQASKDCTVKIGKLNNNQLDEILAELKRNREHRDEVNELLSKVQTSTDKNKTVRDFIDKSENVCNMIAGIIGKIII